MEAKAKKIDWTLDLLEGLKNLSFVEDIDIAGIPDNVGADISIILKVEQWRNEYLEKVMDLITDLKWNTYDETGVIPVIHWDYQKLEPLRKS